MKRSTSATRTRPWLFSSCLKKCKKAMINLKELVSVLGYPMMYEVTQSALKKNGFDPVYKEKMKAEGSVNLGKRGAGIELSFDERSHYEENYGLPKGQGDAIFNAIFLEPLYAKNYELFVFPHEIDIRDCKTRLAAFDLFKQPEKSRERDNVFKWDRWILEKELSIRAEYREDQSIHMWTIGIPMKM